MTEDQLQRKCVLWFHTTYPLHRGMLFEINNKTDKGANRRTLGLVPGASDLMLISPLGVPSALEVKVNGTRHNVAHLKKQVEWGKLVAENHGYSSFIFTLEQFQAEVKEIMWGGKVNFVSDAAKYVERAISEAKTKTIKLEFNG